MTGNSRRSIVHLVGSAMVALATFGGVLPLRAEDEPARAAADSPVAYRHVFVPAGDTASWPRDGEKFLPVEAREFEAWVAAANRAAVAGPPGATITEALYSARLENGQLVDGRGAWTIAMRGSEPMLVALGQTSLSVRDVHWKYDAAAPVRIGAWGRSGGLPSNMGLEATKSGVLEFEWRVPARTVAGGIEFAWQLPPATTTRVVLDLPAGKRPIWEGSLILRSTEVDGEIGAGPSLSDGTPARDRQDAETIVRWEMISGRDAHSSLRIVDDQAGAAAAAPAPTVVLREVVNYAITPRGLDIEAQWRLVDSSSGARQLSIRMPAGVQLVSATVDGQEVAWRLASEGRGAPARVLLELPAIAIGVPRSIVLRAWQVPVVDAEWQLPKLRPDDVYWAAGSAHVSLSPLVELRSIETIDCIQTGVHLGSEVEDGAETISVDEYSPMAGMKVIIGQRAPAAAAHIGTTLVVGNADVTGRSVTRLEVARGALHTLSGELPLGWNVDAVATTPSEALGEWYVDERDGQRRVEVRLAESVRSGRPIFVTLTGRLQPTNLSAPLSAATLQMVRWREAEVARNLLFVQTAEPYVAESVGELPLVAAADLAADDRSLLPADAEGPIYNLRGVADRAAVRLATKRSQYTAEIWLDARLAGKALRQTYHLVIRPQAGRVDQILVYTTARIDREIRWTEKSSGALIAAERVPAGDARRARFPSEGELWELRLPRPRANSVEIDAMLVTPWASRGNVPLMSVPEAANQRGRVLLSVDAGQSPQVETRGMHAIPPPTNRRNASASGDGERIWAAYRYEPAQWKESERRPQFWLEPTASDAAGGSIVARQLKLESYYAANGQATHRATYELDNESAAKVQIRLPEGAELASVQLDGRLLELSTARDGREPLTIPLPAGRSAIVSLLFGTRGPSLVPGAELLSPVVEGEIHILAGEWTVWLPTEFAARGAAAIDGGENWRQRLFGPLGRPTGARPFDPLHGGSWSGLVTDWAEESPTGVALQGELASGSSREVASGVAGIDGAAKNALPPAEVVTASGAPLENGQVGWRAYRRMFVAGVPAPIVIAQPPATTAWSIAVFLLCLAGGGLARRRREWFIVLMATAAILCLMLPAVYAPLATGAFLGLAASLVVAWPQRSDSAEAPTRTWNRLAAAGVSATALAFVLVSLATAEETRESETQRSTQPESIERVLIPVDAERRPVGSKAYISEPFLRRLLTHSADSSPIDGQWLLTGAAYRGELRYGPKGEETIVGEWSMAFGIEVLGRDTTIHLPLVRDEADWPATVQLDGIPVPLAWDADGRGCHVDVAEPGRYELTISFVPRVRDAAGRNQIAVTLPPWWGAAFELLRPAALSGLEIEGAHWQSGDDQAAGMVRGELDETGRIVLLWPRAETPTGPQEARLTELRWLRIGAAGVEMEAKYVAPRGARLPQWLTISADRHWELVADEHSAGDVRVRAEVGGRNAVQVALSDVDRERGEKSLRWRLADPLAVGRLRLPAMELVSPQISSSWLAVSSDPTLECEVVDAAGLPAETGEEFVTLWGAEEDVTLPQNVLGGVATAGELSLGIRPRSVESSVDEVLHVAAGADEVRAEYAAVVTPGQAHRFQFLLTVPAEMVIDQIGVTQDGRPIAVRWSRPAANRINVFFGEELTEPYRVMLAGRVRVADGGCTLPRVASATHSAVVLRVQVYRDESVLLDVEGPVSVDDAAADLPPAGWNARLVDAYQVDTSVADRVRLAIKLNRVETVGETLTTLSHEDGAWWATFNGRLVVRQGQLDTLRIRVPPNWVGPFEAQPAGTSVTAGTTADGRHSILTVRLPDSINSGATFAFEIRGPLAPVSGAAVSVPEIVSESPAEWRNYLAVPIRVQSQEVAWTREGVQQAEPPDNLRPSRPAQSPTVAFRVASSTYRVAVAPQQTAQPSASIRLADTVVVRGPNGKQLTAARFVVVPQGLVECELRFPDDQQLVCVKLDGRPARIRPLDERRWAVSLGAPQLPQILDVVSRDVRPVASSSRYVQLQRPVIYWGGGPLPVETSLWTFGQGQMASPQRVDGASRVTAVDQSGLRLDRLASIAEAATPAAVGLPIPDGYDWFRTWAELLTEAQGAARGSIATSARENTASQIARSGSEQLTLASDRLAAWIERCYEVLGWPELDAPLEPARVVDYPRTWPPAVDGVGGWIHCVADGSADRITVELSQADVDSGSTRMLGAVAIAGLAAASVILVRQPAARDVLFRWPHFVGVLAGVCWWAWLWPSWLGLVLAAGSLLLLFRPGWPGHSIWAEASTVVRIGRPR